MSCMAFWTGNDFRRVAVGERGRCTFACRFGGVDELPDRACVDAKPSSAHLFFHIL